MPRGEYPEPFVPTTFSCWISKASTRVRAGDRGGTRTYRTEPRWDVRGRVDGIQYSKRFKRAGLAEAWKAELERCHAAGFPFDLRAKRFVTSTPPAGGPERPTVFSLTETFYWAHPGWEPKTKILAVAALNRARRGLLAPDAVLEGDDLAAVSDYLDHASFTPSHHDVALTPRQQAGLDWLRRHSAFADSLTTPQIEAFVAALSTSERDGRKRLAPSTLVRYTQPLRACWSWAVARDDIAVSTNPWLGVRTPRKVKVRRAAAVNTRAGLAVDKDVVLDIPQAVALADRCAEIASWGSAARCYVLVMALCGLRPNEAVGLLWEDVELPEDSSPGWLTVRRSRRRVTARWLDPDEDPEWGPLKDRDLAETRRVPIPPLLVERLRDHQRSFGTGPGGLVFHRRERPFDLSVFARQVWEPARASMFPPRTDLPPDDPRQPKLSRLRRHDLRHAACSWWLRSGVDATVCQRWSGHKSLSVFLDVYQGVAPGREEDGVRKLVASLAGSGGGSGLSP